MARHAASARQAALAQELRPEKQGALGRRRFLTYLIAAPTLTLGARWVLDGSEANAQVPGIPSPSVSEFFDLGDALKAATLPTSDMLRLNVTEQGRVVLRLPRAEVGQGLTTAMAMLVAEESGARLEDVDVPLEDARPELLFNQFTGASVAVRELYTPVRMIAAGARARMVRAAADYFGEPADNLSVEQGQVFSSGGRSISFGRLSTAAARLDAPAEPTLRRRSEQKLVGTPQRRIDAVEQITGRAKFVMDLDVPGAKPTVVARAPQIGGTVEDFDEGALRAMPGVLDVAMIPSGVAIMAETFGQALAAKDAIRATYGKGSLDGTSDRDIRRTLRNASLPLAAPGLGSLTTDGEFDFAPVNHGVLETNSAIADVRSDRAEIWSSFKSPIYAQERIANAVGLSVDDVTVHVVRSGGSFGRHLFADAPLEAARISQAMGRPVKLMWSRRDDMQHGRVRPPSHHKIRFTHALGQVLSYEQRVASGTTDFRHGMGDAVSAVGASAPGGDVALSQSIFALMVTQPYNFGAATDLLNEVDLKMNTGSWRGVYTPTTHTAREIMIDEVARELDEDPVQFRLDRLQEERTRNVLEKVAAEGNWGRDMPAGFAQGVGVNEEHRSNVACLVEMDATDPQNPWVTKAVMAFDAGVPINPSGLEAQMLGGLNDGIASILMLGNHIDDGAIRETSYSDFLVARQRNTPSDVQLFVMPATSDNPGGAGETSVAAAASAVANAYARATGTKPHSFPINF